MVKDENGDENGGRDHELAGKVDALIAKRTAAADDRNIPVLTDVVDGPEWKIDTVKLPALDNLPASRTSLALQQLDDSEIDALSHEIFERVFDRIDSQLAEKLEDRLTTQLAAQINAVVSRVLGDLRQDIANEVGDAVNAALADHLRKK